MLDMLKRLIGEDIDLLWHPRAELWPVKIDPAQVDQLLANLFVNARDAIAGVGKITIETGNITFGRAYCAVHPGFRPGEFAMLASEANSARGVILMFLLSFPRCLECCDFLTWKGSFHTFSEFP